MISSEDCREKRVRQGNYCLVKQEGKEDVNSFDNTATTTYALQTGADTGMTILLFLIAATDLISQPWNLSVSWRRGIWEAASKIKGEGNQWVSATCAFWRGDTHRKSNAQSGKCTWKCISCHLNFCCSERLGAGYHFKFCSPTRLTQASNWLTFYKEVECSNGGRVATNFLKRVVNVP